ncbi:hypothetical protein MPC1_2220003 [Methylocella tundrae]|nr:hypothetical protein MPC1_2220003 [Methylocella tundrae]
MTALEAGAGLISSLYPTADVC